MALKIFEIANSGLTYHYVGLLKYFSQRLLRAIINENEARHSHCSVMFEPVIKKEEIILDNGVNSQFIRWLHVETTLDEKKLLKLRVKKVRSNEVIYSFIEFIRV